MGHGDHGVGHGQDCGVVDGDDHVEVRFVVVGDGAVEVGAVFTETPFPAVLTLDASDLFSGFFDKLGVDWEVGLHTLVDSEGVVVGNGLFACASDCVVMLVHSHHVQQLFLSS